MLSIYQRMNFTFRSPPGYFLDGQPCEQIFDHQRVSTIPSRREEVVDRAHRDLPAAARRAAGVRQRLGSRAVHLQPLLIVRYVSHEPRIAGSLV